MFAMAKKQAQGVSGSLLVPWGTALLVLALGLLISMQLGRLDADRRLSDARSQVIQDLAIIRARLESGINAVFSATSGLSEVIAHQGGIGEDLFNALAHQAIKDSPQIRNIAIAPDNVITMVSPLEGNRQAIGLDYKTLPEQYASVRKAMQTGNPVFSGPYKLVQGGRGLIARVPVFTSAGVQPGAAPRYWGVVSVVIHVDVIMDAAGVFSTDALEIGLRDFDDPNHPGELIRGDQALFSRQPVSMLIDIPGGSWQIVAVRKGGWPSSAATGSPFFYIGLVNSFFAAFFVGWLVARPYRERLRNQALRQEIADRIRAEEELRLSEQKYASIFHLMPDMVGITRMTDGCFIEINPGFTRISGWEAQEIIGRSSLDVGLWTPEARAGAVAIVRRQGQLDNYEFELGIKSGEKRDALMFLVPITVSGEDCLFFIARDITELKQAQRILESEQARLRNLLQTVPALIWMKDPEGVYLNCNSRFERFFGAREADIVGKTDYDFVDKELADFFREHDRRAMAADAPSVNEEWITYADDGHRELLETIKTPVRDAAGQLIGVLGVAWDITEKKRIEEALRTERTRFVNLVDSVDGVVWEADASTLTFTYVSRQAERLLGYPLTDWYAAGFWLQHLHPDDRQRVSALAEASTTRGEEHTLEYRFIDVNGKIVWVQDIVTVVNENGAPRWRRGILVDTTSRKEEEKIKRNLEAQLRQAQKMEAVGRLAGGVAHDFNNKLSVILGYADLARQSNVTQEKYQNYINQIIDAASQSRDITRQLLAFSRQETISPQVFSLNTLVKSVQKGLGRFIGEDIVFEVRLAKDLWPIKMDPVQGDQVIMNLIVNARDAMIEGGTLLVETRNAHLDASFVRQHPEHSEIREGDYVHLKVSDTGCGISPETQQYIFEPFYTTKERGRGTGLGLSTVYGIVTQNNGVVLVESEQGVGTTFHVFFPRCDEELEAEEIVEVVKVSLPVKNIATILLVEDEEMVRQMTADILEQSGYTPIVAMTQQEAIAYCEQDDHTIDLLLTDVIMPGMDGRELSRQIQQLRPGIKVLFMSGYAAEVITELEAQTMTTDFIQKPFSMQLLLEKIERLLHSQATP